MNEEKKGKGVTDDKTKKAKMSKEKKEGIYKIILIVVVAMFVTFMVTSFALCGYYETGTFDISKKKSSGDDWLEKYKNLIDRYYFGEVNEEKLREGAIKGYVSALGDPYSEFISKDEMEDYMSDTNGSFTGVGIYMVKNIERDRVQVFSTIKGGSAEEAGIKAGDLILTIDGKNYTAEDMNEAAKCIKGDENTKVKLEILRGENEVLNFELVRKVVKVNQVEGEVLENNIGYIKFSSFDSTTAEDFKAKYEELNSQNIKSLIIDLRDNGGGIVDQALDIADYIVEKDKVLLYEVDKKENQIVKKSKKDPIVNVPIVVLVNENSASSSEILVGALKDLGKAKIVGKTTYGKGIIQQIIRLNDGSGLKLTIEEYQTPNKNKIHKIGIVPDVEVDLSEDLKKKTDIDKKDDVQLQKAIEILK